MKFSDLDNLSKNTLNGLTTANYIEMTDIQQSSIPRALEGKDILGAARTGSGKTLAFLVPTLEILSKQNWTQDHGIGALIISPTRELALQIFMVLRKIGKFYNFSAGLVIGGKDVKFEKERIGRMNILVCTPGRLLQHMDETPYFDCNNLQVLVLDEADRILDLGFKNTLNSIVEFLPKERQTLLFSATQTKSIQDLARLSLNNPEYIGFETLKTPESLSQHYLVCEVYEKYDMLFNFIRTHKEQKVLVFLSSCKQVRFVYEAFCKLQPGTVLMCLHGKQKQSKRNIMFSKFCHLKAGYLFCTDIAARGLDFPAVDWVLQIDCPEDTDTYIHRVGRTARYNAKGKSLLFLLPSEENGMNCLFEQKKIPITKLKANKEKQKSVVSHLHSLCASNKDIKYLAEKSFICYLRSIWLLQKDKSVFDVSKIPLDEYANSLGLPGAPKVKFVNKLKDEKNRQKKKVLLLEENDEEKKKIFQTKVDKMFSKKGASMELVEKIRDRGEEDAEEEEEGDILTLKRKDHDLDSGDDENVKHQSLKQLRKLKAAKKFKGDKNTRVIFDDEGEAHLAWKLETEEEFKSKKVHETQVDLSRDTMKVADDADKKLQKEKLKQKKLERKLKQIQ